MTSRREFLAGTAAGGVLGFGMFRVLSETDLTGPVPRLVEGSAPAVHVLELEQERESWNEERLALREQVANLTVELERVTAPAELVEQNP